MLVMHLGLHSMNIFSNRITNYQVQEREEGESQIAQEFITREGVTYCLGIHYKRGCQILSGNSLQERESHIALEFITKGGVILPGNSLQEGEPQIAQDFITRGEATYYPGIYYNRGSHIAWELITREGVILPGSSLQEGESHIVRELIKKFCWKMFHTWKNQFLYGL